MTAPAWPQRAEDVTAEALIRHQLYTGQYNAVLAQKTTGDERMAHLACALHGHVTVLLLRELVELNPDWADEVARRLWDAWEDGGTVFEELDEWCREYGIPTEPDPKRQPTDG